MPGVPADVTPGTETSGKCGRWDVQERHLLRKRHRTMTSVPGRVVLRRVDGRDRIVAVMSIISREGCDGQDGQDRMDEDIG